MSQTSSVGVPVFQSFWHLLASCLFVISVRWHSSDVARRLNVWICGYRNHEFDLDPDRDHLAVYCKHCGFTSEGVDIYTTRVKFLWKIDKVLKRNQSISAQVLSFPVARLGGNRRAM